MEQTSEDQDEYPHEFQFTREQINEMEREAKELRVDAEYEARIRFRELRKD